MNNPLKISLQDVADQEMKIEDQHNPVLPESVNLFSTANVNVGEDKVFWQPVDPTYQDAKVVMFNYPNNSQAFIDLSRTELYLKAQILDAETDEIFPQGTGNKSALPIDLILQTMWRNVEIKLNGNLVYDGQNNYMYSAFFQYLLSASAATKSFQGNFMGSDPDTQNFDQTNPDTPGNRNAGLLARRHQWIKTETARKPPRTGTQPPPPGQVVREFYSSMEYCGPLFADICNQTRYLLNNTRLEITLRPTSDEFRLMVSGSTSAKLVVKEVKLMVCHVDLNPKVKVSIDNCMNPAVSKNPMLARYPIQKTVIHTYTAPKNSRQFKIRDAFQGDVPTKLVVGMVSERAYHGDASLNPLHFQGFGISDIAFLLGTTSYPSEPLQINLEESEYLLGLMSLYKVAGRGITDTDIGIDRKLYTEGLTLFGFNIDPSAQESAGQIGMPKWCPTQLVINFRQTLPEGVTVLLFATFPDEVTLDWTRVARLASDIPS